jgi:hypothetical protein
MVARDGIEPPTPAFSGPRSTTELPGLSADFQLHFLRGIRRCRKRNGRLHEQCAATTWVVYQLAIARAKPAPAAYENFANQLLASDAFLD